LARAERSEQISRRIHIQRMMDAPSVSQRRWRFLQRQLKSGLATIDEVREVADELSRRDFEAVKTGHEIGSFVAGLVLLAMWLGFLWVILPPR
jgi:uncharacterized protein YacL (UPF0231 family)